MVHSSQIRRLPVGAEALAEGGVNFRVWAPRRQKVEAVMEVEGKEAIIIPLSEESGGYFSGTCRDAFPGALYRYRLDEGETYPDPASRYQPSGPHGPSCVINPGSFPWNDQAWKGLKDAGHVYYEMHVGTFTSEGSWKAATTEIPELAKLGITVIELMPVADFPGRFGWGYDGVNLFAPTRLYGTPDDFRSFVDIAHSAGLGVILDVVYNHFGPEGNYLKEFATEYFTASYETEWGEALNFDGKGSGPVREFIAANASYWIDEFHLDGLRLDATQSIFDTSPQHIVGVVTDRARKAAGKRTIFIIAENEPQQVSLLKPVEAGGYGCDCVWNDDFHHSIQVALSGYSDAYYSEYLGTPQELISAMKYGYLYQGQRYFWQNKRRGTPTRGISPSRFVHFLENHDQVANSAWGTRIHLKTSRGQLKAATALLLLGPASPMLFQGQEFAASTPFLYFADLNPDVAKLVRKGRVDFLRQFSNIDSPDVLDRLDNPTALSTFQHSKLHLSERQKHHQIYSLHQDLLKLRREDTVFSSSGSYTIDGAVLGNDAFLLRFFGKDDDRLILVNFGRQLRLRPAPEPLLAPPERMKWEVVWSSEHPNYGGSGTPKIETEESWRIPGHAAVVLRPTPEEK